MNPSPSTENVKVFVRCRPLLSHELSQTSLTCINTNPSSNEVILLSSDPHKPSQKVFVYDGVFDSSSNQEQIYEECAFSLVENVLEGYNATIFAYGQTGSGKTYSMMGDPDSDTLKGIIPRSFEHIINLINGNSEGRTFFMTASFLEIYNEEIHDLLKKTADKKAVKCELRENSDKGFYVKDLSQVVVHSVADLLKLLNYGSKQRAVGETKMNEKSSRSHSIFNIQVESSIERPGLKPKISVGKLNLVDLAGSERQNKTQAQDERFKEAVKINLSLSALGNVISALVDGKTSHIPYRDSKLTRLLQDSLGGNAKTIMLANINPFILHYDETLGTLRYASRTKMIKNKPKLNEDPKDALIRTYMDEIQKLKELLEKNAQSGLQMTGSPQQNNNGHLDQEALQKALEEGSKEKERALKEMEVLKGKELEEFKEREQKEKEKIKEELKEKEEGYEKLKLDKENLEKMLLEKEQALLQGHQTQEDKDKLEEMRKRIIKQKKVHEELLQSKKKQEEELKLFERKYTTIQDELLALRRSNKELYARFTGQQTEIDDLNREHENEKENLLDTIREQEKELSFYENLVDLIMTKEDLIKVRGHSLFSESQNRYKIPPYLFKNKEVKFPNLTHSLGVDILENQKTLRDYEEDEDAQLPKVQRKTPEKKNDFYFAEEKKDKEGFLATQKINSSNQNSIKRIKVRPVKISNSIQQQPKNIQPPPIFQKPAYENIFSIEDYTSPSLAERTKMKKEYLKALDSMIDNYTEKYGKEKMLAPQNLSMTYTLSFTDFRELEKDLDTQMAKAKKNLNTLLEPLPSKKSERVIQELIQDNPLFRKKPITIEKNSALINKRVAPSPKSMALSALNKLPLGALGGPVSHQPYFTHRKNESDNTGILRNK